MKLKSLLIILFGFIVLSFVGCNKDNPETPDVPDNPDTPEVPEVSLDVKLNIAENEVPAIFEEIGDLVNSVAKSVKKSYKKSEIKKVLVDPLTRKWDKFASKSPKLAQATKGAALLTTGVVLYEVAANKLSRTDN